MSKELVISAASHERRVAILEEGQLVEIYIEREKEFALVGSIYKGKVTRVLPGMQSAFVDIGLDGDAFLYVSDVFENLEDYDHGHPQAESGAPAYSAPSNGEVELLPGESLARAQASRVGGSPSEVGGEDVQPESFQQESASREPLSSSVHGEEAEEHMPGNEAPPLHSADVHADDRPHIMDERQPDSNASAPQNFSPRYNPTQNYPPRSERGADRGGQDYGRGGDRGRGGRWGRRGGRHRGGRSHGQGGRNLPPSKYASPQGGESRGNESRGYENRGRDQRGRDDRGPRRFERGDQRGYDNRRQDNSRYSESSASGSSEEFLLPGESLAKYRGKPIPSPAPAEPELNEPQPDAENIARSGNVGSPIPATGPAGTAGPRRFSGGLPRWLLADAGSETVPETESAEASAESGVSQSEAQPSSAAEPARNDVDLSDDQAAALASEFVEAKHEETSDHANVDAVVGGAEFDEEEDEQDEEETEEETEELDRAETDLVDEDAAETEQVAASENRVTIESSLTEEPEGLDAHVASERAEFDADAAQESAEHAREHGELQEAHENSEAELIAASSNEPLTEAPALEDDVLLLPGETRSPRIAGAPREDFPRDSARIGGNPRARFQRPQRGGRDRDRGRGGRDRGGRPGGHRFERRGPGGGPRHERHHRFSGPPRRPQLISEMLKAGQDVVVQIAKEPLGKKGARITSHVALPGRFLVYMPTVHHTGVSRKIISAENRSRLRRLVSEAGNSYPGGFIVRTAAGGATDDEIRTDIDFLGKTWNEIKDRSEERKSPALLHRDLNLVERILRDYVSDDFTGIWIDNEEEYGKIVEFVSRFQPKLVNKVKLYTKETPIFEEFGIQHELDKALRAKVWLKSGGYIVINHTEALVAIDVNTGKFVGKGSTRLEDTIVKTNLEAVKEIVRQIRLRDLGGIIVVDLIDMEERRNREKVLSALQQALEQDKAPSKALSFNEFGLVCITRKRTKQALERVLCQPCPYCTGSGMVKSIPTLCYEIQSEARKMATATENDNPNLTLRVHPEIAKALKTRESMLMDELEQTSHKHIIIQSDATLHWEQYDIY
ncbi:MAG TPA: Rne/Rng family ribonuclease [Candidatus Methylomirabilis sp.]|nr:Rne/Rng family ribonuclease [Candidatus Methylomirabilis sp.]